MTLLHPMFLLLLALIVPVWIGPWRTHDTMHGLVRSVVIALLAFGLARPVAVTESEQTHRVWILDRSSSVDGDAAARATEHARSVSATARADRETIVVVGDDDAAIGDGFDEVAHVGASDLGAALAHAARSIPEGYAGSVVLMSDGHGVERNWSAALTTLMSRGIPVHVRPLAGRADDARIVGVDVSNELRLGTTASVDVVVHQVFGAARVMLVLDGEVLAETSFEGDGGRQVVALDVEPTAAGWIELEARLECDDTVDQDNRTWTRLVAVQDPRRVVYLGDGDADRRAHLQTLLGAGLELVAPNAGQSTLDEIDQADLVMLDDRPAEDLPDAVQERIVERVRDHGTGLVMSGGRASFGPGGYYETPVASILPVDLVQREEKRDPSTTLVIVIDTSGSMSGQRVQLAKEVARLSMQRLLPHDKVGIVEFYGAKRWAAPIQPASNQIELERALNRMDAGGGTVILPAIEEAFYGLQNVQTRYKHVLVLTDGGVEQGAFEPLLRRMADEGINTSTVLVGGGVHSEFLVTLANWGKGRYYGVPNRYNLPEVLLKQPSSSKLPAYRPGAHTVRARTGPGWWGEIEPTDAPPLAGYVETRARPGAEVLLETTDASHPVLASWRYGLGRVTTLATEPVGEGTSTWQRWPDYGTFLARVLHRTAADGRSPFEFDIVDDDGRLVLRAVRRVHEDITPKLALPGDDARTAPTFAQRSPVHFTAPIDVTAGALQLEAGTDDAPYRLAVDPIDLVRPETQVDPADALDLERVASASGGTVLDDGATPTARASAGAPRTLLPLWPWFLLAALGCYIGDLAWRRRAGA